MARKKLALIDGSAAMFRAYYAMPALTNAAGRPTGAVYGYTQILQKVIRDLGADLVAVFFDTREPTFRTEMYAEYKANRAAMPEDLAEQIPYIKDVTQAFDIALLEQPGYEADDLIGTIARRAETEGYDVVIVTGDKDMLQLVTDRVCLYDPMKDKWLRDAEVRERYGVGPDKVIEVMGLAGDTSDNVPGIPGIGEKTASALIQEFGSVEAVIERVDEVKGAKRKENIAKFADQARLSRSLVTIDCDVPLEVDWRTFEIGEPDRAKLVALFRELDFKRMLQQYAGDEGTAEAPAAGGSGIDRSTYELVLTEKQLDAIVARLRKTGHFALDFETTSLDPMRAEIVGLSLADGAGPACYVPIRHRYLGAPKQLPMEKVQAAVGPLFADAEVTKVGQNIKYDWICWLNAGGALAGVAFDTMLASFCVHPGRTSHGMDALAEEFLGHTTIKYSEVCGTGKNQLTFDQVDVQRALAYAAEDADVTLRLEQALAPEIDAAGVRAIFDEIEMPLIEVLIEMERTGIRCDADMLREMSKEFDAKLAGLTERIHALAGGQFNINSTKQLAEILFERLGLPVLKKGKTGPSTDVSVLEELAAMGHELPNEILGYRMLSKLKSTYIDALPAMVNPRTGRIHTSYQQTGAATGRLSSTDPNLQNIPIRTEEGRRIREAFVPAEGHRFLSADYSQIELRLLAHVSGDQALQEAFREGEDIHRSTAAEVFGVPPKRVDAELRRRAKAINFGIIYGISAFGLARNIGTAQNEAQKIIDRYFATYPGVKRYMDETIASAKKLGYVTTLLGRRRYLPEIQRKGPAQRAAERVAINTPLQGTAADLIKRAMIAIHRRFASETLATKMILQVHDELVFEVPKKEEKKVEALVKEEMERALALDVPLVVDTGWGTNWAEAH